MGEHAVKERQVARKVGRWEFDNQIAKGVTPVFPVQMENGSTTRDIVANDDVAFEELCAPCDEGEAEVPVCLPDVYQPTPSEYADHCVTHYPFRVWCRHCLEGRGREFAHAQHRGEKDQRSVPVISFDYCFVGDAGDIKTPEDFEAAGEGAVKILVARDGKSKSVFAQVVPMKGVDEAGFAVGVLVDFVRWLGYNKIALKSDNERPIVRLLTEALRELRIQGLDQCLEEHSPEYDPQCNGSAEIGVKLLKGHFRTLKSCLEAKIGFKVPVRHPLVAWMIRHSANLITWYARGADGRTGYQRVKTRDFTTRLMGFGEVCRFKNRSQEPISSVNGGSRFHTGIFVGIDQRTGQYMLYSDDSIKLARTVVRVPNAEKWNRESLSAVRATPLSLHVPKDMEVVFKEKVDIEVAPAEVPTIARQIYLYPSDFIGENGFGLSRGCPKCDHYLKHDRWGKSNHSAACRDRIQTELAGTVTGQQRIAAASDRMNKTVWDLSGGHERDLPQGEIDRDDDHVVQNHVAPSPPAKIPEFLPMDVAPNVDSPAVDPVEYSPPQGDTPLGDSMDDLIGESVMDVGVISAGDPERPETDLQELMAVMQRDERIEIAEHDREIIGIVKSLGGDGGKYRRERKRAIRQVVSEIYSPPRVTAAAKLLPELRLIPGFALDLTTVNERGEPWNFDLKVMRDEALRRVRDERPLLLVGSPMCTAFSTWQRINNLIRDPMVVKNEMRDALVHLRFCVELYREQMRHGRYFLHEHPAYATSWQDDAMRELMGEIGVETAVCDQCQYGCKSFDGSPVKKPTQFLTNAPELAKRLRVRCNGRNGMCSPPGGGEHAQCRGKVARKAAVYDFKLCKAILIGFRDQLRADGLYKDGFVGIIEDRGEKPELLPILQLTASDGSILKVQVSGEEIFKDDLTGQLLPPDLVKLARAKELEYFNGKLVWEKRPMAEARRVTGKPPITVRWVDVNKGDNTNPNVRSRLVARQIRQAGEDAIFAPTPPLEALRSILAIATTDFPGMPKHDRDGNSERRTQISAVDISRAYFNAATDDDKPTFVMLPPEDPDHGVRCGLLKKHMYGTRAAADGWQQEYSGFLKSIGFSQGVACPCLFVLADRHLYISVHGDDFTTAGPKVEIDWFERLLEEKYELKKGGRLGPGDQDCKELTVLNRVLRWTDKGVEYEADPRQGERLLESLSLDGDGCKAVATPGQKAEIEKLREDKPLSIDDHTMFRAIAARANYLAQDRIDLQFAAKEVCRFMSSPTESSQVALKRLGRYLLGHKRMIYTYPFQRADCIDVYSDTDWSGCPRTRKSTSGGCIMIGKHCLRTWSSTQPSVTLSSGEAEYYGLVKAAGAGLGHQSLMADLNIQLPVRAWTDSSAAIGIASRSGLGKLRHLETHTLWLQEKVRVGAIAVKKVHGEVNPADIFTKHLPSREKVHQLMGLFGCEYREGRAASAPLLRPHGSDDREGGHPVDDPLPTFVVDLDCKPHDPNVLPHLHSADDIQKLFPSIDAAPEPANSRDYMVDREVGTRIPGDPVHPPDVTFRGVGDTGLTAEKSGTRGQRHAAGRCLQHPREV